MKPCALALLAALALLPAAAQVNRTRWGGAPRIEPHAIQAAEPALGPGVDLHLEFPIYNRALPNRAQLHATLVYDSMFWGAPSGTWQPQRGAGWWLRTAAGRLIENEDDETCGWEAIGEPGDDGSGSYSIYSFDFVEPDGTVVSNVGSYTMLTQAPQPPAPPGYYPRTDCPSSTSLPRTWRIYDGKGFEVQVDAYGDASAWDGYGDNVTDGLTDPNGNAMSAAGSTLYDALGVAVTVSGSGTPSSPITYTYKGPGGANETTTVLYESAYMTANFGCYSSWSGNENVPESIVYPDGSTYTFSYASNGFLSSVTDPAGGTTYYTGWYMGVQCSPFYITDGYDEYNSIDGSAHMWSWTYDSSSNQLIQTDPYGQQTVASYDSSGNVAQQDVYPGAWNNSFRMQRTTYSGGDYGRTTVTALCSPSDPSDGCGAGDSAALKSSSSIDLDDYGMVTSTSTTDWGVGSPPSTALRQTVYTYNVSGNGEVPASVKVEDGSGNVAAETTWGYSGGVNPASESAYTGASTALTTSFTWNTNGTLATVTAPNGGTTTNGYECGTGFFPDSVATPVGSTSANWDCDGGVETSATDLNGNGSSATYDARWRPLSTTNAEGDTTYFTYPSSTNSYRQLERSTTVGGSTDDVITVLDPLGRPSLQQRRQTPGGANFDSVETTYDFDGRPATVSMPYVALAGADEPAGTPVTTTTYDALSRPVKAVDGAGGETDFQYVQNDVLTMLLADGGQPTVLRQRQLDGLGRLASVCEITSGSGIGGNWPGGACGQTNNAGNGYLTAYARNALGEITSVAQNAQGGSKEPRAFQYDELGRLTQETNPETQEQPVTFTYDSDASCGTTGADAGALVKRVDARGIVTCYLHDAAKSGRLDHVTYNDGTPAKYFVYGRSSSETDEGFQVSNGVGRLVEAYTGSHATDEVFDYNKLGRITLAAEATPHSGGWYQTYANYFFNGVPDALLLENGAGSDLLPGEIFYGADGEGRPTTATYGSNALVTAASYSALGLGSETYASGDGHTDSDIYGYDPNTGRLGSYTFSVDGYSDVGRYQWLKNGELSTFSVSDSEPGAADNGFGCSYTHDDLGRLSGANCGASSDQTFTYDPFGNVCKTASAGTNFCPSYNLYNQVAAANYDKDGDETSDPVSGAADAYDAEGRPVTFLDTAVVYDALGRAVEAGGAEFIYGPSGGKIAVMDGQALTRADVPLAGGAEAVFTGAGFAYYRHADALGSARLATTYAGAFDSATAYAPYGEPLLEAGTHDRNFTGQKQDIANGSAAGSDPNGQYDFLQREYSPTQSRWWTPDPAGLAAVDPGNPQSWNRYAYALGDPVTLIDPDGLCPNGTHDATVAEMAAAIQTAETYVGHRVGHSSGSHWQPGPHPKIDCSGLVMCALAGARFGSGFPLSYLGLNLTTRSIDQWTDPGTGAVGDIIYFAHPGHVGIVTGPNTFIGSQTSTGPRSNVQFGPTAPYWGKPGVTSSPVFRRACVADQQHATSAGGGGGSPVGGGGGMPGQSPFGGVDQSDPPQISWVCAGLLGGPQHCSWHVYFNKR